VTISCDGFLLCVTVDSRVFVFEKIFVESFETVSENEPKVCPSAGAGVDWAIGGFINVAGVAGVGIEVGFGVDCGNSE